jgi:glycosyltransferase involved in cell wall biosynthesis
MLRPSPVPDEPLGIPGRHSTGSGPRFAGPAPACRGGPGDRQAGGVRLVLVAASPVYYQVPLYRRLAADPRVWFTALFCSDVGVRPYDAEFGGRLVRWDTDLLGGYHAQFLRHAHHNDVGHGFWGLRDWDVVSCLRRLRPDVVWLHGASYLTLWLALVAARLTRRPVLLREEQTLLHPRPPFKRPLRALIWRALCQQVYALYIGSHNRAFFRHYGVPERRLFFVPYTVDNEALQRTAAALRPCQAALRRAFGVDPAAGPLVLFVGKLIPKKQPHLLLEAFARVRRRYPCALLFVGEGPLMAGLRRQATAAGIPDVHFAGFLGREQVTRAYAAADLFVLPSGWHETWGVVVNEAMNFDLPVVVSDAVGCAPDLVHEGDNGYVVPRADADRLAEAIAVLVRDEERRRRFGQRSRAIIAAWHPALAAEGVVRACYAAVRGAGGGA